ncbi:MAG: hypothetical protein M3Z35_14555 [Nitrospirota bacterium]|nr:hypothetical protein [Nitrospirota bacterium]
MKRLFLLLLIMFPLSLLDISSAQSVCSARDQIDLIKVGYSKAEINNLCKQEAVETTPPLLMGVLSGEGQARWVQWCATPQGRCPLFSEVVGYYPVGFPCNCYMPWGFYAGTAE